MCLDMINYFHNFNSFLLLLIIIVILIFFTGFFFNKKISCFNQSLKIKKRFKIARKGEISTREFLIQNNFKILKEQAVITPYMTIDNKKYKFSLRADFIVFKKGIKALVDAKTGSAINPLNPLTRRQMLEYFINYDVQKVYLFDASNKVLREVSFEMKGLSRKKLFLSGAITGSFVTLFLLLIIIKLI